MNKKAIGSKQQTTSDRRQATSTQATPKENLRFPMGQTSDKMRGYTLIEILVAVAIFFVLVAGPAGLFVSAIRSQIRALALREIIDNSSHAIEYISRSLRMAKKDLGGACITAGYNYENPSGLSTIKFLDYEGFCRQFYLSGGVLRWQSGAEDLPLTSDDLEVTELKFEISGASQGDTFQPKVTMLFEIKKRGALDSPTLRIQTTTSQRNLDVIY